MILRNLEGHRSLETDWKKTAAAGQASPVYEKDQHLVAVKHAAIDL